MKIDKRTKEFKQACEAYKIIKDYKAKYDATDPTNNNVKQRRQAKIETSGEDKILRPYERMQMINLCRDLVRNSGNARGMLNQLRLNTSSNIKARFTSNDEKFNESAGFWFNSIYSKECDYTGDLTLSEICENIVTSRFMDGDVLIVFDDFWSNNGRLRFFESDQIVSVSKSDWEQYAPKWAFEDVPLTDEEQKRTGNKTQSVRMVLEDGIIKNRFGEIFGFCVSGKRGSEIVPYADANFIHYNKAKLMRKTFRFGQLRGVPELAPAVADLLDSYEMRTKELASAKLAATLALMHKSNGAGDLLQQSLANSGDLLSALDKSTGGDGTVPEAVKKDILHNFEALSGAAIEYLDKDEEVSALNIDRPNLNAETFYKEVSKSAGAALGIAKCYSTLQVDSSYTAFRGEMLLTWVQFRSYQKWLEKFLDWLVVKAIDFAVASGDVIKSNDPNWKYRISWSMPQMEEVDKYRSAQANAMDIKNGFKNYLDVHGPNWKEYLTQLADELKTAKDLGLPLSVFEMLSGGIVDTQVDKNNVI